MAKQYASPDLNTSTDVEAAQKPERPFALKVVCALLMIDGLLLILLAAVTLLGMVGANVSGDLAAPVREVITGFGELTFVVLFGATGGVLVWVAVGLWRLDPWAWRWAMIAVGVLLIVNLWTYYRHDEGNYSTLALLADIIIVFYLIQPEVRRLYIDKPTGAALPLV